MAEGLRVGLDNQSLKKFGITMAVAFLIIALLILIRHKHNPFWLYLISGIFFALSLSVPNSLKLFYICWMKLASILSWINTRLILFIIFYLVFTPIGMVMRLFGVDLLDRKMEKAKESYWRKKEKKVIVLSDYERQF